MVTHAKLATNTLNFAIHHKKKIALRMLVYNGIERN